jgi:hypothetical protein
LRHIGRLTMRLSDAGLHQRRTKTLYPNHRLPPWLTKDATGDRSNRLLDAAARSPRATCIGLINMPDQQYAKFVDAAVSY